MKLGLLLHLYQPSTQEESVLKQVFSECYSPLIKLIKNRKSIFFTLNIPLSLLEALDKGGYKSWIQDLKELYDQERVEIIGSGAYHPLLTKLPIDYIERQIILNEYGLGYYIGSHQGFEGEDSFMVRNIVGFFAPEMAINEDVVRTVENLGYLWLIADENALPWEVKVEHKRSYGYTLPGSSLQIIIRDRSFSNLLAFKRDTDMAEILQYVDQQRHKEDVLIVALDGETFGHHYKDGMFILESLLDYCVGTGIETGKISDLLYFMTNRELPKLIESTWGASDFDIQAGNAYPFWSISDNELQMLLWELQDLLIKNACSDQVCLPIEEYARFPVWFTENLKDLPDKKLAEELTRDVLLMKFMNSDKFWWASRQKDVDGKILFNPAMIKKSLEIALEIARSYKDPTIGSEIIPLLNKIHALIG